jgi:hypothetical protein
MISWNRGPRGRLRRPDQAAACGLDVALDLELKGFQRGEGLFVAEARPEEDLERAVVEVFVEVKEMDLEAALGLRVVERGTLAEVEHGGVQMVVELDFSGVDAVRRKGKAGDVKVGCGKAEFLTQLITGDDTAGDRVAAPEQPGRLVEIAAANELTNTGRTNGNTVEAHRVERPRGEAELPAEGFEQFEVPGATVAEGEAVADAERAELPKIAGEVADEAIRRDLAEGEVKPDDDHGVEPAALEEREAVFEALDKQGGTVGGNDGVGMLIESEGEREALVSAGVIEGEVQQRLVAEVNSVEDTDGGSDGPAFGGELTGPLDDLHSGPKACRAG